MEPAFTNLTPTHFDVLYLLVIGAQRDTIVRDLYLSARTIDQRIADLKYALNTPDRFGLGVSAIRWRWIDPAYPIGHASARRESVAWVEPSHRQYAILRLRAGGATIDNVAKRVNLSTSCVRKALSQLAADNGARNAINAGALFVALGWIQPLQTGLSEAEHCQNSQTSSAAIASSPNRPYCRPT